MSTILNTEGKNLDVPRPKKSDARFAIIYAQWNEQITGALRDGAVATLHEAGLDDNHIDIIPVPGTVELIYGASRFMNAYDAIIVIGCVIRGDTPHFDYVCQIAAQGVAELNARGITPVIFGVLTVNTLQQAIDRAGGALGNKGSEAAVAAITMANLA